MRLLLQIQASLLAAGIGLLWGARASAGPISYEGGWMLSTENQADSIGWQLTYSPKPWISLGVDYAYDAMEGTGPLARDFLLSRVNVLLKRWNESESQGNVYLYGGAGAAKSRDGDPGAAWLSGLEADWETRRLYTSGRAQWLDSTVSNRQTLLQGRVGLAPYLTDFEGFHSWVILQLQYVPEAAEERLRLTPLMRFYTQNVLWELGVSARGTWTFNTMIHF